MKLIYKSFQKELINKKYFNVIVIEDEILFLKFHEDLYSSLNGWDESFFISQRNELIQFDKITEVIVNPFNLTLNERRLINKLSEVLSKRLFEKGKDVEIMNKWNELNTLLSESLLFEEKVSISFEPVPLNSILKYFDVSFENQEYKVFLERVFDYLLIKREYEGTKLFIFSQLSSYLIKDEILEFIKFCNSEEINVLLIEKGPKDQDFNYPVDILIIDRDLCEIFT